MERKLIGIIVAICFFGGQAFMAYNAKLADGGIGPRKPQPRDEKPPHPPRVVGEHKEVRPWPMPCPPMCSHSKKEI